MSHTDDYDSIDDDLFVPTKRKNKIMSKDESNGRTEKKRRMIASNDDSLDCFSATKKGEERNDRFDDDEYIDDACNPDVLSSGKTYRPNNKKTKLATTAYVRSKSGTARKITRSDRFTARPRNKSTSPSKDYEQLGSLETIRSQPNSGLSVKSPQAKRTTETKESALFLDSKTYINPITPGALQYVLRVVKEEVKPTMEEFLVSESDNEECRRVTVRGRKHITSIIDRIRNRVSSNQMKIPTKHTEFKGGNAGDFIQVNKKYLKDIESNTTQAIELQAQLQRENNALSRVKQRRKELMVKIKKIESGMETPHSLILDVLQDNNGTGSKSEGVGEEKEGIGTKWQEQVFPKLKLHRCEPPLAPSLGLPSSVSKTSPSKLHEWMDSLSSPYDHE